MRNKWTWSDLLDRSPWGLATLLWAHTTVVAVLLLIVAVYPSRGLFLGWLHTHLLRHPSAFHQPISEDSPATPPLMPSPRNILASTGLRQPPLADMKPVAAGYGTSRQMLAHRPL